MEERQITIGLGSRIDAENAARAEQDILNKLEGKTEAAVILDGKNLEYISSAGLRVLLRLRKTHPDIRMINVSPQVYEILETTGFTEMLRVEKAFRAVSVEGCEVVGEGFNGRVYRLDGETVVKVYKKADALPEIRHEREVARLALILGVPTAISYDVVRVGDRYGSVFELLNARSFANILAEEPERLDWCVRESTALVKTLHGITVPEGKLPSKKAEMLECFRRTKDALPAGYGDKLLRLTEEIPESDRMLHGDFHTKNIVLAGDEVLLIDMDTLSVGQPIFELAQMFSSYVGFSELDPDVVLRFQGYAASTAREFWKRSLRAYLGTEDTQTLRENEEKIRCVSYADLIDWRIRHPVEDGETQRRELALWTEELTGLLDRVDSLLLTGMK